MKLEVIGIFIIFLFVLSMNLVLADDSEITINSVKPLKVVAGNPTDFVADISHNKNTKITSYKWDFGNKDIRKTTINKTTYTYDKIGNFELNLTVFTKTSNYTESFNIEAISPKGFISETIEIYNDYLIDVKDQLYDYDEEYRGVLEEELSLNYTKKTLDKIEQDFEDAEDEEEYISILEDLLKLKVPLELETITQIRNSDFFPNEDVIDLDTIKIAGGGSYNSNIKERYIAKINEWVIENIDLKITYQQIFSDYIDGPEYIMSIIKLSIVENGDSGEYYLFIKDLPELVIRGEYGQSAGDYVYISGGEKDIEFITTEEINLAEIPVFISPKLDSLEVAEAEDVCNYNGKCEKDIGETWENCDDCSNTGWIILIVFLVIIIGIIAYLFLQEWYKREYERHLFKDRNNLFNIVNYINKLKEEEVEENKIKKNLRKAGWTIEQISYAMKRYKGKNTGMPGLFSDFNKSKRYNKTQKG